MVRLGWIRPALAGEGRGETGVADVVRAALGGIRAGKMEILADDNCVQLKAALSAVPRVLQPQAIPAA
ncbi:hypothetical protein ACFU8W_36565 [Streptomyces sp. NPDC057565]|uniref:hypothetical protein n=1 Tax=Streptomyces sp. NPDC057565 TaxID=3346169 RepID=UPI0036D031C3